MTRAYICYLLVDVLLEISLFVFISDFKKTCSNVETFDLSTRFKHLQC